MKTPVFIQTILDAASLSGRHVVGLRGDFRLGLAPASAGVRRSGAGLPHYGGMVAQPGFLPVIGLHCTALSARHGHDALAHFHSTSPSLYAAVPLAVAVPQASVAGGVCLS